MDDFTPIIFLEGVLNDGTDLALPANLTSDRRALLATTPLYGEPLLAGNHSVLVSLNGQQLSAKLAAKESAVGSLSCISCSGLECRGHSPSTHMLPSSTT